LEAQVQGESSAGAKWERIGRKYKSMCGLGNGRRKGNEKNGVGVSVGTKGWKEEKLGG